MKIHASKKLATTNASDQMRSAQCRACHGDLYSNPLLSYSGMPAAAQHFLDVDTLSKDKAHDLDIYQCAFCGLIQLNNEPVPYYKDVIRASAFSEDMQTFRQTQFNNWVTKYQLSNRRVLEVGCGKGEYLSLLNFSGVDAYGIEHASPSVDFCINQGLKVSQGYLGDSPSPLNEAWFDGFICLNFMEHWPDPACTLRALSEHLSDGAIGLMEVPNFDMVIEKGLFSEFITDHLLYFTQSTLRTILESNGFDVLECKPIWHDYILSAVVRKRSYTNLDFFEKHKLNITHQLNEYIDRWPGGKVAIWGAGHQSLAVIALANLANKITYVIDSAPFKQGKYTPATHLPIAAPSHLESEPVVAIIIMAASYSDEVARVIRSQYSRDIHVAILRDHGLEEID
jgi:SAM-dependent methyltransferase